MSESEAQSELRKLPVEGRWCVNLARQRQIQCILLVVGSLASPLILLAKIPGANVAAAVISGLCITFFSGLAIYSWRLQKRRIDDRRVIVLLDGQGLEYIDAKNHVHKISWGQILSVNRRSFGDEKSVDSVIVAYRDSEETLNELRLELAALDVSGEVVQSVIETKLKSNQ